MNVKLMPNDINLDFFFYPPEIYKSDEDIRTALFNPAGSVIAIITKTNTIRIYDFIGKMIIFSIPYYKENEKQSKLFIYSV